MTAVPSQITMKNSLRDLHMFNSSKKYFRLSALTSLIMGIFVGAFAMYAAWMHNSPYGEIHTEDIIHWGYWFEIGILWFIASSIVIFILIGIIPVVIIELWARLKRSHNSAK